MPIVGTVANLVDSVPIEPGPIRQALGLGTYCSVSGAKPPMAKSIIYIRNEMKLCSFDIDI